MDNLHKGQIIHPSHQRIPTFAELSSIPSSFASIRIQLPTQRWLISNVKTEVDAGIRTRLLENILASLKINGSRNTREKLEESNISRFKQRRMDRKKNFTAIRPKIATKFTTVKRTA
jgi:hypothetical protein